MEQQEVLNETLLSSFQQLLTKYEDEKNDRRIMIEYAVKQAKYELRRELTREVPEKLEEVSHLVNRECDIVDEVRDWIKAANQELNGKI